MTINNLANLTLEELNKIINKVISSKAELHRKDYTREISKKKYEEQLTLIDNELKQLNARKVNLLIDQQNKRDKELEKKTEKILEQSKEIAKQNYQQQKLKQEQQNKQSIKKKPVNKNKPKQDVKETPYKTLIVSALKNKEIDSEEKLLYVVLKLKPGKDKEILRRQVRNIISIIKQSDKYKFDANKYLLSKL